MKKSDSDSSELVPFSRKDPFIRELLKKSSNDPILTEELNNPKFVYRPINILKLIEEYNVRVHKSIDFAENTDSVNTIIFRRNASQSKEPLSIQSGNRNYILYPEDMIEFYLPTDRPSKLCFGVDNNQKCTIIKGSKYLQSTFEMSLWKNGILRIDKAESISSGYFLTIKKAQEKRAKKALKAKTK